MRLPAAERREQLLSVAITVFAEKGFHNTSMNDVADAAGVTKPVLYQHFASKRALYLELLAEIGAELRDTIAKATADAAGPRQQINLGFVAYFEFVADHADAFRVLFGDSTRRDEEFADEARRVESSIAELAAEHINIEGLSWERRLLLGNGIVGLAEGSCRYWLTHSVEVDATTLAGEVSQLAWAGLRGIRSAP
ncbi:MAG: TetR/AcrR family transcriptional regulator [Microthrixaceae bacterium]|nr:TetR/AcrR family transcriptional regulator [Microthrixaceae bacterium]